MSAFNSSTGTRAHPEGKLRTCLLAVALTCMAMPVHATVTIPDVPLQSGSGVAPNIMFIVDDSGSMHSEIMPDALLFTANRLNGTTTNNTFRQTHGTISIGYLFPRASGVYGGNDYGNFVINPASTSAYGRQVRSPQINTVYYNPAITYRPWVRADGTLFPNATTTCALHNPERNDNTTNQSNCRNLTTTLSGFNSNFWQDVHANCGANTPCNLVEDSARQYWPATYYWHNGTGSVWNTGSFQQVEIRSTTASYTGHGRSARTDAGCVNGTCTYAAEIQNFANWYTYYRSRILASRAGIGRAFSQLNIPSNADSAPRVGFAAINAGSATVDNVSSSGTIVRGVRPFVDTARSNWFSDLYGRTIPNSGTPLRRALDDAGQYFSRSDAQGPWSSTPGAAGGDTLTCRQSFSILMTDGYWTEGDTNAARTAARRADFDSTEGPVITSPTGTTYRYQAREPFQDSRSNTLADVAMYYWSRDLLPDTPNRVPTSPQNPAFWQHMVTFGVGLGVTGSINPQTAFDAIESGATITWPDPVGNEQAKIDDLLHAAVNSRGGFFSASDPNTFAEELTKTLTNISERTASGSNVAANSVALREETRIFQASYVGGQWSGELASYPISAAGVAANPSWRATDAGKIPGFAARRDTVFTRSGGNGTTFHAARSGGLGNTDGFSVADYLLGNAAGERRNNGPFRNRSTPLGDIVNSSPAFNGQSSPAALFVGANDGMMHAFNAETGEELFGYVPASLTNDKLRRLSSPAYSHEYYVDGPVTVSSQVQTPDRNILVGTLGRGGKGVYALDVTDPDDFQGTDVLWDTGTARPTNWTNEAWDDLGLMISQPLIVRTNAQGGGNSPLGPMVLLGNGLNSTSGHASLMVIDAVTGQVLRNIRVDPNNTRNAGTNNALTSIRGWDKDGDGIIDYVYGADIKGNVWKFDLDWNDITRWGVADGTCLQGNCGGNNPVQRASGGDPLIATGRPITGGLQVGFHPTTYDTWVMFGTGKYLEQSDVSSTNQERWYGVADTGTRITNIGTQLTQRSILVSATIDGTPVRGFEPHTALPADSRGWFINLQVPTAPATTPSERMVATPLMVGRVLVAASIIPSADPCESGGTGYLNAVDGFTGTSVQQPFFDVDGDGSFDDDVITLPGGGTVPVGSVNLGIAMPTSPTVVENLLVAGGSLGTTGSVGINNPLLKGRISWREILGD